MQTNIKSLEDYINRKRYWRVLRNTYSETSSKTKSIMIGRIYEQKKINNDSNTVVLGNKDNFYNGVFNLSDLQEVYGEEVDGKVEYFEKDGYAIGVGDTIIINGVGEWIVYDFKLHDNLIALQAYKEDRGAFQYCSTLREYSIDRIIPLHNPQPKMSDEELIAELERRGKKIKQGKIRDIGECNLCSDGGCKWHRCNNGFCKCRLQRGN